MNKWRKDFPILKQVIKNHPLIYFDNAATSQKPQAVIDAITLFYTHANSNVSRSICEFGEEATRLYSKARETVAAFINAHPEEVVFTQGTTHGINFTASTWAAQHLKKGDQIVLSELEHHSNIIPWQQIAKTHGLVLKYIPVRADGTLDLASLPHLITSKTKLVSVTHVSNSIGTHNDIHTITQAAHAVGAKMFIDAAQSIGHQTVDVKKINCDFLAFSGHKVLGPTGIGVLFIKKDLHAATEPYQFGGGMIYEADFVDANWLKAPYKFEAGTPPIAQAVGLAAAIDYLQKNVSFSDLQKHEAALCRQMIEGLSKFEQVRVVGPLEQLKERGHMVSFVVEGIHAHDVAAHLSHYGICVRAGNHCAQPLAKKLAVPATVRASFYLYNTAQEIEKFLEYFRLLFN